MFVDFEKDDSENGGRVYNVDFNCESFTSDEMVTLMRNPSSCKKNQMYYSVEYKFCVLFRGRIWYLNKGLL